jgi:16S rRNA processing protein RimM
LEDGRCWLGRLGGPFGLLGWLHLSELSSAEVLRSLGLGARLWATGDGRALELTVSGFCKQGRGWRIKFAEVGTPEAARALKGLALYVEEAALPELLEGQYYHHQLLGLPVFTPQGVSLGAVSAVLDLSGQDLLQVQGPVSFLVPLQASYLRVRAGSCVELDPPAGLIPNTAEGGGET